METTKVLLVSDEDELKKLFGHALERRALRLNVAMDEAQAVEIARRGGCHSAFLDFDKADLDPGKLLSNLKGADKDIIVTGIASLKSKARAVDSAKVGLSNYLIKPILLDELYYFLDRQEELKSLRSRITTLSSAMCSAFPLDDLISTSNGGFNGRLKDFVSILAKLEKCNVHELVLKRVEKALIELVLDQTRGNKIKAANMLGLNRNTLHSKIKEHNIVCKRSRKPK